MQRFLVVTAIVLGAAALPARADFVAAQIGQFVNDGSSSINWTLNTSNNTATLGGSSGGFFLFNNINDLPAGITDGTPISAHMTITGGTNLSGFTANGQLNQPLTVPLTVDITQDGTGLHLLTATVSAGQPVLSGVGSNAAVIASEPRDTVTYSSNVLSASDLATLNASAGNGLTLALAGIQPGLSFNPTAANLLNSFSAAGSATFSGTIPEPASIALFGLGCVVLVGAYRRPSRQAA